MNDIEDVVDLEIQKLEGNSSDEILDTEEEIHLGDTQAVSYTHLDVYKRQI